MLLEPASLPDDAQSLKQIILSLRPQNDHLQEMVRLLKSELFGGKSESLPAVNHNQPQLFGPNDPVEPMGSDEGIIIPEHTRKRGGRKPLPEDLPPVEVVHDLPEGEKRCACGAGMSRIAEQICEKLDYIPAKVQVIRATEGLLAHIAVSKFTDALPLYRQQKIFDRLGVELSRSTTANRMIQTAVRCRCSKNQHAAIPQNLICGYFAVARLMHRLFYSVIIIDKAVLDAAANGVVE